MMTWVEVKDPDGNPATVTYEAYNEIWKDLGYEIVKEPDETEAPAFADADETDEYSDVFTGGEE